MSSDKRPLRIYVTKEMMKQIAVLSIDLDLSKTATCEKLLSIALRHLDELD